MRERAPLRVGVFGGSFNPPHLAHRMLLGAALNTGEVDIIWMVPTFRHAFGKDLAPYADRVAMCERVAASLDGRVVVSRLEAELGGESRTLPLLEAISRLLPEAQFRLVVGADILVEAQKWYRWDDVVACAPPLVFGRETPSSKTDADSGAIDAVGDALTLPDISSTEVRARLEAKRSVSSLLPQSVVRYIVSRGLYS